MKRKDIYKKVQELTRVFTESYFNVEETQQIDCDNLLKYIISNSQYAINYLVLLEEEFDIEIDDDDINLDFFQSVDNIVNSIVKTMQNEY